MGGVLFYEMSWADPDRSIVTPALDNNSAQIDFLTNRDPIFTWSSIGANSDATTVTYTVDFGKSRSCDTLFLLSNNLKNFELQYWDGAAWQSIFTETTNAETDYQKTFSTVSTQKVRLLMNATMTADQEKQLGTFFITSKIGQLVGYPIISVSPEKDVSTRKMLNGKEKTTYFGQMMEVKLEFKDYMNAADRELFTTLYNRFDPFLVWPNGGDSSQFSNLDEGYRKGDVYLMTVNKPYTHTFSGNGYFSGMNAALVMDEVA